MLRQRSPLTLVILRRRFLSPKDLVAITAPKEVKITQSLVKLGRFGLFAVLLGRISTGSSFSASRPTNSICLTTPYHFVPHLSCKLLIVKKKLEGLATPFWDFGQNTRTCG
jgi:hypothetical protein